ncbi:MAG: glycosyltransferase [Novosphingobium sp.]
MARHLSGDAFDSEAIPRPIVAVGMDLGDGIAQASHRHPKAELVLTTRGLLTCEVAKGLWMVPPQCALWIPGGMEHSGKASGELEAYVVFVDPDLASRLPAECCTVSVDSLLRELYGGASALLMPSLCEGFGLPLLEAMSCGVPVLTSNSSSMPEVVGDAGVLVDPLDVAEIAQGIRQLAEDSELRASLGANARRRSQAFSWDKAARETLDLLFEAAGYEDRETESGCIIDQ